MSYYIDHQFAFAVYFANLLPASMRICGKNNKRNEKNRNTMKVKRTAD